MPVPDRPAIMHMVGEAQAPQPLAEAPEATQPEAVGDTTSLWKEVRIVHHENSGKALYLPRNRRMGCPAAASPWGSRPFARGPLSS